MEQKLFCDDALNTILGNSGQQFLGSLDAVAGTGKNFTLNVLIAKLKAAGKKVFAAAYAGIAGALLIGGSTFHIRQMHQEIQHLTWYWALRETQNNVSI